MANATVQRFRKLLQTVGCYDIRITRHMGPGGRIQYTQYRVRFVEPVGHSEISGIFSLADMQRSLQRVLDAVKQIKAYKAEVELYKQQVLALRIMQQECFEKLREMEKLL